MTKSQSKLILTLVAVSLTALGVLLAGVLKAPVAPPQPEYQGMALQQIRAEPQMRVTSHEDIMRYRSEALAKMGEPAAGYLMWMIRNPRLTLDGHSSRLDRLSQRLPGRLRKFAPSPPKARANFMNVVIALQLLGPKAREAVPDLLKLWDSKGNPEYAYYNGFPLTLVALGDASPKVLTALHQRFSSPDRLHLTKLKQLFDSKASAEFHDSVLGVLVSRHSGVWVADIPFQSGSVSLLNEGMTLSATSLAALVERGIEMGLDIYSGHDEDEPNT